MRVILEYAVIIVRESSAVADKVSVRPTLPYNIWAILIRQMFIDPVQKLQMQVGVFVEKVGRVALAG